MKAVGRFLVIDKVKEEETTRSKLMGGLDKDKEIRYIRGVVLSKGMEAQGVSEGDEIYYDKHAGHGVRVNDDVKQVIRIEDVAMVL